MFRLRAKALPATRLLVAAACLSLACNGKDDTGEGPLDGPAPLVDPAGWSLTAEADDPFSAQRPPDAICDSLGYGPEDYEGELALFVETGVCNYATFEQPALGDVAVGERLRLRLYHDVLRAPEPSVAHAALIVGDDVAWESAFGIPSSAELIDERWIAANAVSAGDPIRFHVRNHGENSWALIEVSHEP